MTHCQNSWNGWEYRKEDKGIQALSVSRDGHAVSEEGIYEKLETMDRTDDGGNDGVFAGRMRQRQQYAGK